MKPIPSSPRGRATGPLAALVAVAATASMAAQVHVERVPNRGVQPKLAAGPDGTLHLAYLAGEDKAADVKFTRRTPGSSTWGPNLTVNSQAGSALAVGTIRGADLAVGRDGWVHVVWNGSGTATPRPTISSPLLYARMGPGAAAFEPQRNLIHQTRHLDGGGTVAADSAGNVYVLWHGSGPDVPDGEENRTVYLARSNDDGRVFEEERRVSLTSLGACGCCGMKAHAPAPGRLMAIYRTAGAREQRDSVLLVSQDRGQTFTTRTMEAWKATSCPMSLPSLAAGPGETLVTWETGRQVGLERLPGGTASAPVRLTPPGEGRRKHPTAATNRDGETLLVWSEGTGWLKGGAVEWQLFDASGKPSGPTGHADGLPVWSLPAVAANPDGSFLVLY